jgi:hypothetical protein
MEKIDIEKLEINQPADYENETIPYKDIQIIAEKVNEIVDFFNFLGQREPESATLLAEFNQMRSVKS